MWKPISESELEALLDRELSNCTAEQQDIFARYRVAPYKVSIHRLGNLEEVFVVAELPTGVVYYEDVEEGFELDHLGADGAIPEQGCNQYELRHVLSQLKL
jgi:hypothetical protein